MDNPKEIYRLWFEYLRRSDDYREFCEWFRARHKDPSLPVPDKFKKDSRGGLPSIVSTFVDFLDVHSCDFDDWWNGQKDRLERIKGSQQPGAVEDYVTGCGSIEDDLNLCIDVFKRLEGREPSANELKDWFLQAFLKGEGGRRMLLLRVDLAYEAKDIKAEFKKMMDSDLVKKKMADAQPRRWLLRHKSKKPTGKPRIDDLQKYLDVYDMWKEKVQSRQPGDPGGWDEIIRHFEPGRTASDDTGRRVYLRYKQNAERIISNVEKGCFPGQY